MSSDDIGRTALVLRDLFSLAAPADDLAGVHARPVKGLIVTSLGPEK
jgi:hypothetical protein